MIEWLSAGDRRNTYTDFDNLSKAVQVQVLRTKREAYTTRS